MNKVAQLLSAVGLAMVITPACLYLAGIVGKPQMSTLMLLGTVLWFVSAPLWIESKDKENS